MNNLIYIMSLQTFFERLGKKFEEFFSMTDNVWAGTIIFVVLMVVAFAYINSYTKK